MSHDGGHPRSLPARIRRRRSPSVMVPSSLPASSTTRAMPLALRSICFITASRVRSGETKNGRSFDTLVYVCRKKFISFAKPSPARRLQSRPPAHLLPPPLLLQPLLALPP